MARVALIVGVLLLVVGLIAGRGLKIGDLDKGAPELRQDSPYNLDSSYITTNFSTSTDLMTVFVGTPEGGCEKFKVVDLIDRLGWRLQNTPGVQSVSSPATTTKDNRFFGNEGNLKFYALPRDERVLQRAMAMTGFTIAGASKACNMQQIDLELADHKQGTLQRAVDVVQTFAAENDDADIWFRLGDGNATYEAATNQVIERAQYLILAYVYGVVALMCLLTFRSVLATVCVLLPLVLTSVLCQGLMAMLGIGVKVATLPVIALGVGIGVDYGIYIFSRLEALLREGLFASQRLCRNAEDHGQGGLFYGHHPGGGRGHLVFFTHQVPGGYGRPADLHVLVEHDRGPAPAAGTGPLSDQTHEVCPGRHRSGCSVTTTVRAWPGSILNCAAIYNAIVLS